MKLLKIFFLIHIYLIFNFAFGQTLIPNVNADYIKIDPYGNIYAVKEAQLLKFSPQGKLLHNYSNSRFGVISSIDVFNPMKIMLFYQDAGILLFLNEQLAQIREPISLFEANYQTISLASYSSANQIHLYDNANKYLYTLDFFMREISKTPIHFPAFNPIKMIELEEKSLVFHDTEAGIYLFDAFGTFNKMIPIITPHAVTVTSELIYYPNNDEVCIYNYKTLNAEKKQLPISDVVQTLFYRSNMILLLNNGTISIY